jgi:two-component system OmpR family sensor kinase
VYVVLGGAWILFSDRLLDLLVADQSLYVALQTAKGWLFVLASGVLVFALVRSRERRLATANERTERALRQAGVLHRVLRHNLRNVCNVIQGNTELLAEADGGSRLEVECTEAVREETERLVELSEKTQVLQDVLQAPTTETDHDVAELLSERIERLRQEHPGVTVDADLPSTAAVGADERLPEALEEVLANAVEHHDARRSAPRRRRRARRRRAGPRRRRRRRPRHPPDGARRPRRRHRATAVPLGGAGAVARPERRRSLRG